MTENLTRQRLSNKLNGIFQVLLSVCWIYRNAKIIYDYQFGEILYAYMIPEWILILEVGVGFNGIIIGILVFNGKWAIRKGNFLIAILWMLGLLVETLSVMK